MLNKKTFSLIFGLVLIVLLLKTVDSATYSCSDPCALSKNAYPSTCVYCSPYNCTTSNGLISFCTYCGALNTYRVCGTYSSSNRSFNYNHFSSFGLISLALMYNFIKK